ncbi:hypothetical protein AAZR23_01980 [Morganella sp. Je.2.23]|uniref:hypothetical protein n=1 Tax=Morganella sp. Je.2.23 TaxID=3142840 RepID=UPI003DA99B34
MSDLEALFIHVLDAVTLKQAQVYDTIYIKGWNGLKAKSTRNVLNMLNMKDSQVDKKANELYEKISKRKDPLSSHRNLLSYDNSEAIDMSKGVNAHFLDKVFWSSVNYQLAIKLNEKNDLIVSKIMAIKSLCKSLEILSEGFGLGVYSHYYDELKSFSKQRVDAGRKGGTPSKVCSFRIRKYACELLYENKPRDEKWKNKSVAARGIMEDLQDFIEKLEREGNKIGLRYNDLERTIMTWSREDSDFKHAMEVTTNVRKTR